MKKQEKNNFIISADIGGSHITAAIIDVDHKDVLNEMRIRTYVDCHGSADEILTTWAAALNEVRKKSGIAIDKLALAMPGPFDYTKGISFITGLHKYESLYGLDIKSYLSAALNIDAANIRFRNDAEAFLQGEMVGGAGQGFNQVMGFTLGTGMGSAVSIDGITLDANWGGLAYGATIADDYFSTRWFLKQYHTTTGLQCSHVKELAKLALNDERAANVFSTFAENFAGFIRNDVHHKKPDLILLGGNIAKAQSLFLNQLKDLLSSYIDPHCIVAGTLEEDAALIGAAFTFGFNDVEI